MKALLLALSLLTGSAVHATGVKYKSFAEIFAGGNQYYMTCSTKGGSEQLHISLRHTFNAIGIGSPIQISGSVAIVAPSEALFAHAWDGLAGVQLVTNPAVFKFFGEASSGGGGFSKFTVEVNDSTNGRFKGKVYFANGPLEIERNVNCGATSYTLPRPD